MSTGDRKEAGMMKEKNGEHPAGDAGQLILLGLFLVLWVVDSFYLHWTDFPADHVPQYMRLILAGLFLAFGFLLAGSGHSVIYHGGEPKSVRSSGAFRYVRHPLYLGSLLFYLALTVATGSLISLALTVLIFIFYDYIAGYEEKLMLARFGDEYCRYMNKTGKWIPRPGRG